MMSRKNLTAAALAISIIIPLSGCGDSPKSIDYNPPVTVKRFAGNRLHSVGGGPSWYFSDTQVVIEFDGQPLTEDLVVDVLGSPKQCHRIDATWKFDEGRSALTLANVSVDGIPLTGNLEIFARPAGAVRVNLGSDQYNVFQREGTARFARDQAGTKVSQKPEGEG